MFRLIYLTFYGEFKPGKEAKSHLHESPGVMTAPLVTLAVLCFFLFYSLPTFNPTSPAKGWFGTLFANPERAYSNHEGHERHEEEALTLINTENTEGTEDNKATVSEAVISSESHNPKPKALSLKPKALSPEPKAPSAHELHIEHIEHISHNWAMLISILVAGLGILIATMGYLWSKIDPALWQRKLGVVYRGMFRKWWCDEVYNVTAVRGTLLLSKLFAWFDLRIIDGIVDGSALVTRTYAFIEGWFDLYIVDGLVNLTAWIVGLWGRMVRLLQGGQVQRYIFYSLVAVGLFIVLKVV